MNALSYEEFIFISFRNFSQNFTWISDSYYIRRNVFCYDTAGSDYDIVTDCYARKNCNISAEPNIISYRNRMSKFQ